MHGTTVERSLRASAAAAGATRLVTRALVDVLDSNAFTSELWQALEDLHLCVHATARAAAAFATTRQPDERAWETILATLARLNLQLWASNSATTLADELVLMDVLEELLDTALTMHVRSQADDPTALYADQLAVDDACIDDLVTATHAVSGADAGLAVHVLVGVALRAMSESV